MIRNVYNQDPRMCVHDKGDLLDWFAQQEPGSLTAVEGRIV